MMEQPSNWKEPSEPDLGSLDSTEYWMGKNPTPQERADVIVKRLEQIIRGGKSDRGGISFKRWQELAVQLHLTLSSY